MAFRLRFSFATVWAANFCCNCWNWFRIMPEMIFKFLRTAIWSAVWLESKQTPDSWTSSRFRSVALHRIRLGTHRFVSMPYFYTETSEHLEDWAKRWVLFVLLQVLAKYIEILSPMKYFFSRSTNPIQVFSDQDAGISGFLSHIFRSSTTSNQFQD